MLRPNSIHAEPKAGPGHGGDGHPRSCMITGPSHHTLPQVQGPIYLPAPHTAWLNVEAHKHLLNEQMSKWMNELFVLTSVVSRSCSFYFRNHSLLLFLWIVSSVFCDVTRHNHPHTLHSNPAWNPWAGEQTQKRFEKHSNPRPAEVHPSWHGRNVCGRELMFMHLQCKWFITWFILRSFWLNSIFHDMLSHRNSPFTHGYFELLLWPALWIWHLYSQTALLKGNGNNTVDLDQLSCRGSFDETNPRACWGWEIVFGTRSPSPALSW